MMTCNIVTRCTPRAKPRKSPAEVLGRKMALDWLNRHRRECKLWPLLRVRDDWWAQYGADWQRRAVLLISYEKFVA